MNCVARLPDTIYFLSAFGFYLAVDFSLANFE